MKLPLPLVAITLAASTPADACHRFSVWKYPYPQRCAVITPKHAEPAPDDRVWFVEIERAPDDIERERAIEALKQELAK